VHAQESAALVVVDTVGAGDCFLAGLVVAMLSHHLPADWGTAPVLPEVAAELLANAVASASFCVTQRGCVPPLREQVTARLGSVKISFQQP
jgi:fructokinase